MKFCAPATSVLIALIAFVSVRADVVSVNLNVRHSVGGVSEFDRSRFVMLHAGLKENDWDSNQMRSDFLTDYDVYLGRNNGALPWFLSQTPEDPSKAGWIDRSALESSGNWTKGNYTSDLESQLLEGRVANHMIGGQMNMYPNGQENGRDFALGSYEALADYFDAFLSYYYGEGGSDGEPKPAMVEVVNEPFVKAWKYDTTKSNIAELHNVVAEKIKSTHPDVLVGGYTAAHPAFEAGDFGLWNTNWKMFIDTTGDNMDFYSVHLYDYLDESDHNNPAQTQYRSGSNVEAILDMIEHYSMIANGEVKPFAISEFGSFEPISGQEPWTPESNWSDVRSFSSMLMQLMERPDRILQAMPFVVLKAEWGRDFNTGNPYGPRLLRQRFEDPNDTGDDWVFTELIKFYQLWSNVDGIRVDTTSDDPDLQVDAYVDGKRLYLILNNLEFDPKNVDLRFFENYQNPIVSLFSKQTYAEDGVPKLDTIDYERVPQSIELEAEGTMILEFEFDEKVKIDQTSDESKYYAKTYLERITANSEISFEIDGIAVPSNGETVLRIGIGRDHGRSLSPEIRINGDIVDVPEDWRGYDQGTRDEFFGVIEIPVLLNSLQANNSISVKFPDSGGHVSSVAMQVWSFSAPIRNVQSEDSEGFLYDFDASKNRFTLSQFGRTWKNYTVVESNNLIDWEEVSDTKSGAWDWLEFDIDAKDYHFLKIRETDVAD